MSKVPINPRVARFLGYPQAMQFSDAIQENLKRFWMAGFLNSLALALTESFYTLYALSLGMTGSQIGLVNTLAQLSAAGLSMPGAVLADRTGRYKRLAVLGGVLSKSMWLVMALSPLFLPPQIAISVVMVAWVGITAFNTMGGSAWTALSAELVPATIRGKYFASRNITLRLCKLLIVPVAGFAIKAVGEPLGYQISLFGAFLVGMAALATFNRLPEHPKTAAEGEPFGFREMVHQLPRLRNFVYFTITHSIVNLGVMIGGPFTQVYLAKGIGLDVVQISLVTSVGVFTAMVGMYVFGRLQDRKGITWIMRFAVGMPLISVFWLWANTFWQALIVQMFAAFSWTGYILGSFALLLAITPDEHRPRYVALHTTTVAIIGALGPFIGGRLLDSSGFVPTFVLSSIIRALGMILFFALVREPSAGQD
ncbi:MFS transporter [Chloroflexota bacterium]